MTRIYNAVLGGGMGGVMALVVTLGTLLGMSVEDE